MPDAESNAAFDHAAMENLATADHWLLVTVRKHPDEGCRFEVQASDHLTTPFCVEAAVRFMDTNFDSAEDLD